MGPGGMRMAENRPMPCLVLLPGLACDERLWEAQLSALPAGIDVRVSDVHMRHPSIEPWPRPVLREHEGPLVLCGARWAA